MTNAAGDALRALDTGDLEHAGALLTTIQAVPLAHWKGEGDGLFPASLTALTGEDWNTSIKAWQSAHPNTPPPRPADRAWLRPPVDAPGAGSPSWGGVVGKPGVCHLMR
ncbi:hypothetical protein AB0F18_14080 [Streptomyces sp. NPDC029216]|uniref:hypothetical protein n=1 Tax=Streptomyces sp. NPDC029216 TaxID=3154701 RepID=UPI0033D4B79B